MGIITYLQRRILQKEYQNNSRVKSMKNLIEMKSILVVCSVKSIEEWEKWQSYFNNMASHMNKIEVIGFLQTKEKNPLPDSIDEFLIVPQKISWLGRAKDSTKLSRFVDYKYDVLIDLNFDDIFILNWLFVKSNASLKVGYSSKEKSHPFYDLIIKTEAADKKQKLYIDQVFYFLRQINKNGNS